MRFAEIIGNDDTIADLRAMVDSDKIPHAMLISGPSGLGKMMAARAFISYLNCENRIDGDSCGVCPACRRIDAGNNPDIHYVYPVIKKTAGKPAFSTDFIDQWKLFIKDSPYMDTTMWPVMIEAGTKRPVIYVDEADAISAKAAISTYADRYKVFVIWLPERMNPEASNKLLKLIEEPYDDTLFIFVSNNPELLLPTVASRLRSLRMNPQPENTIVSALLKVGVSESSARQAARMAEGIPGKAFESLSGNGESAEFHRYFMDCMRNAYARKIDELKKTAETLSAFSREKAIRFLEYLARMTRENFIANLSISPLNNMTPDEESFSTRFAPFIHSGNVEKIVAETETAKRDISRNANAKLVWFDFLLRLMLHLRSPKN